MCDEKSCIMLSGTLDRNSCSWQPIHCMCEEKGCILLSGTLDPNLCSMATDTLYVLRNGLHIVIRHIGSKLVLHGNRYTVCVTKRAAYCYQAHWIQTRAPWQPIHCMCDETGCILLSGTLDRNSCSMATDTLYV